MDSKAQTVSYKNIIVLVVYKEQKPKRKFNNVHLLKKKIQTCLRCDRHIILHRWEIFLFDSARRAVTKLDLPKRPLNIMSLLNEP